MVNHRKSWAGNVFVWLDLTLDPFFKVERGYCFYYATIAYHVGLNADLGLPHPGPTS